MTGARGAVIVASVTTLASVVTEDARLYYAQFHAGLGPTPGTPTNVGGSVWDPRWKYIRWGEGGWQNPGPTRRTPDASLRRLAAPLIQDLDAAVDVTRGTPRYAADERAVFQKAIAPADVSYISPGIAQVRCLLDFGEFNNDGFGNSPRIWELGLFADHPAEAGQLLMVAYATFDVEVKTALRQVEKFLKVRF